MNNGLYNSANRSLITGMTRLCTQPINHRLIVGESLARGAKKKERKEAQLDERCQGEDVTA